MSSSIDWRRDVAARAAAAGITLPEATIEEMAEHLDEIYAAALRHGASEADAQARARAALEESTLDVLRGQPARCGRRSRWGPTGCTRSSPARLLSRSRSGR